MSIGQKWLKNIPKPVQAYRVAGEQSKVSRFVAVSGSALRNKWVVPLLVALSIGLAVLGLTVLNLSAPDNMATPASPVVGDTFNQRDLDDWATRSINSRKILEQATFQEHDYALVHAWGIKWVEAEAEARAMGGYLAEIGSQAENDFLVDLIAGQDDVWRMRDEGDRWQRFGPWIGLVQKEGSNEPAEGWEWSNGEPVAFTNWFWHQPDNYDGSEHFGRFRQFSDQPGIKWDDARHVSTARGYLVEFEGSSIQN